MINYEIVSIAGFDYPVAFNRYAMGELLRDIGVDLSEFLGEDESSIKLDFKHLQKVAYYGLVGGYAAKYEKDFPLSYMQAAVNLFDDNDGFSKMIEIYGRHTQQQAKETEEKPEAKVRKPKAHKTQGKP